MEISLATYHGLPELSADCQLLLPALRDVGFEPKIVDWQVDDPDGATLMRSVWNYYRHRDSFLDWIDGLPGPVLNPPDVIHWNSDKSYLARLAGAGISVVPSVFFPAATREDVEKIITAHGWENAVVKPTVSANAWRTLRIRDGIVPFFRSYETPVIVQPYVGAIEAAGEWSLMFFDGEFSHAVLKRPAAGDFRVQDDWGGTVESTTPDPELIREAARVLELAELQDLPYARIDAVVQDDAFLLMELELIEPELFFRCNDDAARRFADVLQARLT